MSEPVVFSVSQFVAVLNQTLEYAFNSVVISGELANFRISKGRWVYFDLKDELASVKFFGTVFVLPGPLEDGMTLEVRGNPRLHPRFGFSVGIQSIQLVGEGVIKKAADLLQQKLEKEGLFAPERKRALPYPPSRIGLITSSQAAAYHDFIKVISARWGGLEILHIDVQVQGESAPTQIVSALEKFNGLAAGPDVVVVTRGGGSVEDLAAFSDERVVRAVAASRIPTLVAIGHEVDVSLAELAADKRASTPSNAAELLVPDKQAALEDVFDSSARLSVLVEQSLLQADSATRVQGDDLSELVEGVLQKSHENLELKSQLLRALNPKLPLQRGFALVRHNGKLVRKASDAAKSDIVAIEISDAIIRAEIGGIRAKNR